MIEKKFEILPTELLERYCENVADAFLRKYHRLEESELSIDGFSFYSSVATIFSSKIEGENIELDSYVKHKRFGVEYLPDYTRKIDDLYDTYQFAKGAICNKENILEAHKMLTKHLLSASRQGKTRTGNIFVTIFRRKDRICGPIAA